MTHLDNLLSKIKGNHVYIQTHNCRHHAIQQIPRITHLITASLFTYSFVLSFKFFELLASTENQTQFLPLGMHSLVAETTLRKVSYINGEHIMLHVESAAQAQGRE